VSSADSSKAPRRRRSRPTEAAATVVGIGASAGGLDAFRELVAALPPRTGMTFVLLQHLSDETETQLPAILGRHTSLPIDLVKHGQTPERDHIYVVPAGAALELEGRRFRLFPHDGGARHPIDRFLGSLAATWHEGAVAVILSGTGNDGALGVREVAGGGGIVLVQEPSTAAFDAMPKAAIATGCADRVLSPQALAAELARIAGHPVLSGRAAGEGEALPADDERMERVYELLRNERQTDFHQYRRPTVLRRVARRMVVNRAPDLDAYIRLLEADPDEVRRLYDDLLIHVTRFFRDPETYGALETAVFPRLVEGRAPGEPIRVWVPGCSTGEEPYSIAITLLEYLANRRLALPIQVFGTDISEETVDVARSGMYAENCADDIPPELLRRHFLRVDGGYRVSGVLRDLCVFARQDLLHDPPFSHLDLVVCRNVLIYLEPTAQKRIIGTFHYALRPTGFLMLGMAETTGSAADLFTLVDKRHRIYRRRAGGPSASFARLGWSPAGRAARTPPIRPRPAETLGPVDRLLLERYAPPGVLVDDELKIVQTRGRTGTWLELPPGTASLNLFSMLREGLVHGVRAALHAARTSSAPARREGLRTTADGRERTVAVEASPVDMGERGRHFLLTFEESATPPPATVAESPPHGGSRDERLTNLQSELDATRSYMESMIRDLESANEELQAANEEILSSNEELQSTNEELDTTKEELQSTNEELNTINDELHARNEELSRANSDLVNLLSSVQIAIVMVDSGLRIRRFTPAAEKVLHLIATDLGRPVRHFTSNLECPDLEGLIAESIDRVVTHEREVRDTNGRWHALRIRPYKDADNRIDGAVLSLIDVNALKRHELEAQHALAFADAIIDAVREPLLVLDADMRVRRVNTAFCRLFRRTLAELDGRSVYEVDDGRWDAPALRTLLEDILPRNRAFDDFHIEQDIPGRGRCTLLLNGRRIAAAPPREASILLAMQVAVEPRGPLSV
jgi:two-component system CheB/CheR fusion protein